MAQNVIRVIFVVLPLLSAFFIPKKSFVKYLPVTLFSTLTVLAEIFFFIEHGLMKVGGGKKRLTSTAFLFTFGPYFFSNLWVFHLAKGKAFRYTVINLIADFLYAFPIIHLLRKANFLKLKVSSIQFFALITANAVLNYIFQKFYERAQRNAIINSDRDRCQAPSR
ncbi:hypothetical protein [Mesobacillus maritimus]|uniref:GtrA-like protein domain-containing protein n=1 Tax=Mesobacillus maritimus TaxID=1643336 RepID=A0ABS7K908_9BACI|nr:hypothetical protein [Mesobacillus maritimus]MBY0098752.1 hypothetical protein [Mesobacillus maritimus]